MRQTWTISLSGGRAARWWAFQELRRVLLARTCSPQSPQRAVPPCSGRSLGAVRAADRALVCQAGLTSQVKVVDAQRAALFQEQQAGQLAAVQADKLAPGCTWRRRALLLISHSRQRPRARQVGLEPAAPAPEQQSRIVARQPAHAHTLTHADTCALRHMCAQLHQLRAHLPATPECGSCPACRASCWRRRRRRAPGPHPPAARWSSAVVR